MHGSIVRAHLTRSLTLATLSPQWAERVISDHTIAACTQLLISSSRRECQGSGSLLFEI